MRPDDENGRTPSPRGPDPRPIPATIQPAEPPAIAPAPVCARAGANRSGAAPQPAHWHVPTDPPAV